MNRINYLIKKADEDLNNNDKVAAAITLRSLLEETINRISLSYPKEYDNLCDKINYLYDKKYIDETTKDLFHNIRLNGNLAAHSKPGVCSIKELKNYYKKLVAYLDKNLKNNEVKVKNTKINKKNLIIVLIILYALIMLIYFIGVKLNLL